MMKRLILLSMFYLASIGLLQAQTAWDGTSTSWTKGSGTQANPYLIEKPQQLAYLAESVNGGAAYSGKYFKMTANIDLGGAEDSNPRRQWTPIGNRNQTFQGKFDGGGYEVNNMYVNQTTDYAGLFGNVENGNVSNLGIGSGSSVSGGNYVGGVAGYSNLINNCYNKGNISGVNYVGGLAGAVSIVINCYNIGNISGNDFIGGLSGNAYSITDCYNIGNIVGRSIVGGLSGSCQAFIANSYNIGSITGNMIVGGIMGKPSYYYEVSMINCYKLEDKVTLDNGVSWENGNDYGDIKTNVEMRSESFADLLNTYSNSWLFDNNSINNGYPVLYWSCSDLINWIDRAATSFGGGNGTVNDPYLINNEEQLAFLAKNVNEGNSCLNEYFKLTNNLDLKGVYIDSVMYLWTPIGIDYDRRFRGNFDGGGYGINNIYINQNADFIGLFGYAEDGIISNLGIINGSIRGNSCVGGIAGFSSSLIYNSYNKSTVLGYHDSVGGIAGGVSINLVTNSYNEGIVFSMRNFVGGIVGMGSAVDCYNIGSVSGESSVGGIIGKAIFSSVSNCYNMGNVSGNTIVGGIAGETLVLVDNCYSIGNIVGNNSVGGITGDIVAEIVNCYKLANKVTLDGGASWVNGNEYGEVKTSAEMKTEDFVTLLNGNQNPKSWFSSIGSLNEGYPVLLWQLCTIIVNTEIGGTVTGGGVYLYDETVSLTATADEHYHFVKWNDGNIDNPRNIITNGNATYTALFEKDTYTITAIAGEGGIVTGSGTFDYGKIITLKAKADVGYHFAKWNDENTDNPRTVTVTDDATYTAEFAKNRYVITATAGENGTITPAGETTVDYNESVTYIFNADEKYEVYDVVVDGVSIFVPSSYTFNNVHDNHTIHVVFGPEVGVEEIVGVNVNIYSFAKTINISIDNGTDARFEVIDITGRVIASDKFDNRATCDVEMSGVYVVKVMINNKAVSIEKVIIR